MTVHNSYAFINGKNVDLRPLTLEHVQYYANWNNEASVRIYARTIFPITVEDFKNALDPSKEGTKNEINFEIWHREDEKVIGLCELSEIQWPQGKAFLGALIGEPDYWNQDLGSEVTKLLVDYAFLELNFLKLKAYIITKNVGSWKCAEKNGFIREAVLKNDIYVGGEYLDAYLYGLSKEEWLGMQG